MGLFSGVWLAVLGILGASNLIIARKPDARQLIAALAPYQGFIGAISALWGVWGIIGSVLSLRLLASHPIYWLTFLAAALSQAGLGLLLGVGTLKTFIKQPQAVQKMDEMAAKLAPFQGTMGLFSIGVGAFMILVSLVWAAG